MGKKTTGLVILVLGMILSTVVSATLAAPFATITMWTDKQQYSPGEKGILYITYYNRADTAVQIKNITVTYEAWNAYIGNSWVGNQTKQYTGTALTGGEKRTIDIMTFTVPSDGRAVSTTARVDIATDQPPEEWPAGFGTIDVMVTSRYSDQLISLVTIIAVLIIVSAIVIAAAIFLTARRPPQIAWRSEEKQ